MLLRKSWGWSGRVEREVDCQVQPNFIEPRIGAKLDRLHHTPCSFDLPPLPTLPTERFYLVCRLCCLAASLAMTLQYAEPTIDPPSLRISSAIALRAAYRSRTARSCYDSTSPALACAHGCSHHVSLLLATPSSSASKGADQRDPSGRLASKMCTLRPLPREWCDMVLGVEEQCLRES